MTETHKTLALWGEFEKSLLKGNGIDIGCGSDPVSPSARRFDVADGDANRITDYVKDVFDYVYSSHCLEHMVDAPSALFQWWQLVKAGGYLILIVPDEDLYEQGEFPSRFNHDHKWTFTISKSDSWSPKSINLLDLAKSLPNSEIVTICLQDNGYDRRLLKHGYYTTFQSILSFALRCYRRIRGKSFNKMYSPIEALRRQCLKVDQTDPTIFPRALAQIQVILRKVG
jgi:SAM-dependent methyltransferase